MATTKRIEIAIDTTDDAMVGGGGWDNFDPRESVLKFLDLVREEVEAVFPGYAVTIEETEYRNTVYITDDREYSSDVENDAQDVRDAISAIWERQEWFI